METTPYQRLTGNQIYEIVYQALTDKGMSHLRAQAIAGAAYASAVQDSPANDCDN